MFGQQLYESDKDRRVQEIVAQFLRKRPIVVKGREAELSLTLPNAKVDFVWKDGNEIVAVAEMKRRNVEHTRFPTLMVSFSKILEIQKLAPRGYLLLLFKDGLFYRKVVRGEQFNIQKGGRTADSRDKFDAMGENCAYIPMNELKMVPGWDHAWHHKALAAAGVDVWR